MKVDRIVGLLCDILEDTLNSQHTRSCLVTLVALSCKCDCSSEQLLAYRCRFETNAQQRRQLDSLMFYLNYLRCCFVSMHKRLI